jgi:hypothetical protein
LRHRHVGWCKYCGKLHSVAPNSMQILVLLTLSCVPCLHGITWLRLGGFSWNLIFDSFLKICWEYSSFISFQSAAKSIITTICDLKYQNVFHFVCSWEFSCPIWYWSCVFHIYVAWFLHTVTFGSSFLPVWDNN